MKDRFCRWRKSSCGGCHLVKAAAILFLALLLPTTAGAAELRLRFLNDPVAGNERPDDLYTSELRVELTIERFTLGAGERMFTDRQRNLRFDESSFSLATELPPLRGWTPLVSAGVVRVGRGLFGERVQNRIHELTHDLPVHLTYPMESQAYGVGGLVLRKGIDTSRGLVVAEIDLSAARGFRSWLQARALVERPLAGSAVMQLGLGIRGDLVEAEFLPDLIEGVSPIAHLGVSWRILEVRWTYNEYGTRSPHLVFGLRTSLR